MKRYLFFLIALGSLVSINAQNTTEIPVQSTKNLIIKSEIPVHIFKSDSQRVKVTSGKQGMKGIIITPGPEGVTIEAKYSEFDNSNMGKVIEIFTANLDNITVNGNSSVFIEDEFSNTEMNITISGNSDMMGTLNADHFNITATGASDIRLKGVAESINAVASGASDLRLLELETKKITIVVSGASDAYIDVKDELTVVASGSSDVYYKSEPPKINSTATGSSEIKRYDQEYFNYLKGHDYDYNSDKNNYDVKDSIQRANSPQNSKRFAARPKDMFSGGKWHQDLVWMGIDLGIDGLVDLSNGFDLQPQGDYNFMELNYGRNAHVRVNFFEWRFNLVKNVFNIVTGMGMDFQHFAFAQKVRFDEADDYPGQAFLTPVIGAQDSVHSINRSRLAVQYFNVPLFFNLRTKKTEKHKNQFNFTFGVVGGIKTGSSSRIQYTENGYDAEEEKRDDFNLSTFTATAMVRVKYSFFSIYASYQFTPMFRGQNPNLYPFTLGVTLLSW